MKTLFRNFPDLVAAVASKVLRAAEVVLLFKGNAGYKHISLISALAKGFEAVIEDRCRNYAEDNLLLSHNQYGFRKRRFALIAIRRITQKPEEVHTVPAARRHFFLGIILDVKNAFNSLPSKVILDCLVWKAVPSYLVKVVSNYLEDREVPRHPGIPKEVELLAYTDDLAITGQAKTEAEVELRSNRTHEVVSEWIAESGLTLLPYKSGSILLKGTPHIRAATTKAASAASKLASITPNIHRPAAATRRRLVTAVAESIVLYEASARFSRTTSTKTNRDRLRRARRLTALQVIQAYRTVSTAGTMVLGGTIP